MKQLLVIILFFIAARAGAASWALKDDFEGANTQWGYVYGTTTGATFNDPSSPIEGAYSFTVDPEVAGQNQYIFNSTAFGPFDDGSTFILFTPTRAPASGYTKEVMWVVDSGYTHMGLVGCMNTGTGVKFRAEPLGSPSGWTSEFPYDQPVCIWTDTQKGTGANGRMDIWVASYTGYPVIKPSDASANHVYSTTGANTAPIEHIQIGTTYDPGHDLAGKWDHARVSGSSIGDNPDFSGSGTFYVDPAGNDSTGDGSAGNPWATPYHAVPLLSTGDTLILNPGTYSDFTHSGYVNTAADNLTIRGYGNQTTLAGAGIFVGKTNWDVGYLTFSNILYNFHTDGAAFVLAAGANHAFIHDITMRDCTGAPMKYGVYWDYTGGGVGTPPVLPIGLPASSCIVSNMIATNINQFQQISVAGTNNLITHCAVTDSQAVDLFWGCGTDNIYEYNYAARLTYTSGNHPDMVQTGSRVDWGDPPSASNPFRDSYHNIFRYNQLFDCPGLSLGQMNTDDTNSPPVTYVGDWEIMDNLLVRVGLKGSIDIPEYKFWNNTLIQCCTNSADGTGNPITLTMNYDPEANGDFRGVATNASIVNNALIGCGQSTTDGFLGVDNDYRIATNTWALSYSNNFSVHYTGSGWTAKTTSVQSNIKNSPTDKDTYGFPTDINPGTNPGLVLTNLESITLASLAKPMLGSPLIDAGAPLSSNGVYSIDGLQRTFGSAVDIGAHEFDPNLILHFDFDETISSNVPVPDVTGYGHDGWNLQGTNWIQSTSGKIGNAGLWTIVGVNGSGYNYSQYLAVTNTPVGQHEPGYITNGTISAWVLWDSTAERGATILDGGDPPQAATPNPELATNSWALCYGKPLSEDSTPGDAVGVIPTGPVFKLWGKTTAQDINHPDNLVLWQAGNGHAQSRDSLTWHLLTVTWTASGAVTGYDNGVEFMTTTIADVPWLRINTNDNPSWLTVGAAQHGVTYGLGTYPNDRFFAGKMDEVMIFDRALDPTEVWALYQLGNTSTLFAMGDSGGGGAGGGSSSWQGKHSGLRGAFSP